jgi:hypothetical protein
MSGKGALRRLCDECPLGGLTVTHLHAKLLLDVT